ncbi:hypothetical protein JCM14036_15430 [Desulfotomaculum defluvii]
MSLPGDSELPDYGRESVPRVPQPVEGWFGPSGTGAALHYTEGLKAQAVGFTSRTILREKSTAWAFCFYS